MMNDRSTPPSRQVAIIGAALAGLFAAAACAAAGHQVTLLERDDLADDSLDHPGVPQGRQPHVFLLRGLQIAEDLLPGLRDELRDSGAVDFDSARLAWLTEEGWLTVRPSDLVGLSMSRPLFEQAVRRRVLALPAVRLVAGRSVTGLRRLDLPDRPWRVRTAQGEVAADIVIDASGRGSRLAAWLPAVGVRAIPTQEVDTRMGYAVREYTDVPDLDGVSGIIIGSTPTTGRGGLALPIEGGHWQVLASGTGDRRPPRDVDGFEAALRAARDPALADFAARSTPVGEVLIHRRNGNRRHRYEKCRDWPAGLLVVGDSFVSFNPLFGQGITVAALEALILRSALGRPTPLDRRRTRGLMRRLARAAALPWAIAVGQDLRQPTSTGEQNRMQRLTSGWVRELGRQAAHGSFRAQLTVNRLFHMVGSPAALLSPALIAAAARHRLGRGGTPVPRPAALDVLAMVEDEPQGSEPALRVGNGAGAARTGLPAPVRRPISAGSRPSGPPGSIGEVP
jgi:2-polyprenyl-6-methoxyphenol hydroxylase-like FAD-dependent oxidoreductase